MTGRVTILLIEDDPDDVMLLRAALAEVAPLVHLEAAADGLEGLDYLRGRGRFAGRDQPALALLDWRLPESSGLEVLREIRGDPELKRLPVIVLTTSASAQDVSDAYEAGANCFVTKPTGLDAIRALSASLVDFWLGHARLPQHAPLL